jgi:hypothetical protein
VQLLLERMQNATGSRRHTELKLALVRRASS